MSDLAFRNQMLERENESLRERVARLEAALLGSEPSYAGLGLPRAEERVLATLMARTRVTKEHLHAVVYADRLEADTPPLDVIESHASKLRKKLRAQGIDLTARRHLGYALPPDQKDAIRRLLAIVVPAPVNTGRAT